MHYDVIIAGGGIVGLTLAGLLEKQNRRVAVLEKQWPVPLAADAPFDTRVSAISRASQRVLQQAGGWDGINPQRRCAYESMVVWDATGNGEISFQAAALGEPDLGHIIENRVMQAALLSHLQTLESVDLRVSAHFTECQVDEQAVTVQLEDGQVLTAELLVGADGAHSRVRAQMQQAWHCEDYGQKGLVCVAHTSESHQHTAWQRFLPSGPLAFLPLPDKQQCSIVWTLPADQADKLLQDSDLVFNRSLEEALGHRLGEVMKTGERVAFPLQGAFVDDYVQKRLALIGDAAHVIHPLAGQGANLGFMDAKALASQIAANTSGDCGSLRMLRRYERARRWQNQATLRVMEGFNTLFGNRMLPWQPLRNSGMSLLNQLPMVKNQLARQAMGL